MREIHSGVLGGAGRGARGAAPRGAAQEPDSQAHLEAGLTNGHYVIQYSCKKCTGRQGHKKELLQNYSLKVQDDIVV